jgi:hypothetical protein
VRNTGEKMQALALLQDLGSHFPFDAKKNIERIFPHLVETFFDQAPRIIHVGRDGSQSGAFLT